MLMLCLTEREIQMMEKMKTMGVDKDNKLNDIYGNKYRIPLDHEIMEPSSQELSCFEGNMFFL